MLSFSATFAKQKLFNMLRKIVFVFLVTIIFYSCEDKSNKFLVDDAKLPDIQVDVKRYGKAIFEIDTLKMAEGLKMIKAEFPLFLNADLEDTSNVNQIKNFVSDTALIRIYNKTTDVFPNNQYLDKQLSSLFSYLKYHFPTINIPTSVYTYVSGMQYESPVYIQDSIMIIGLDLYLGGDFLPYYGLGLPKYKIACLRPENLDVDVAKQFYNQYLMRRTPQNTLLDRMISAGKLMYYLDAVLPYCSDSLKICYTTDQLKWCQKNEENIWAFLIDNDLLFSTDYKSQSKLMMDGPFTSGFSKRSPARIGIWVGWQIIRDYMENNPQTDINDLLNVSDSQKLLHDSGYKP